MNDYDAAKPNGSLDTETILQRLSHAFGAQEPQFDPTKAPKKSRFANIETEIKHDGKTMVLPADPTAMTYPEAKDLLDRAIADENEMIAVSETIEAFPLDGAVAFMKAVKQIYGWATPLPPKGFFEAPPTMTSVETGPRRNDRVQIIWGKFKLPGIDGELATTHSHDGRRYLFAVGGRVKKKHLRAVAAIADLARDIIARESIYRGKALRMQLDNDNEMNPNMPPKFLDTSEVRENELVFSEALHEQVVTNLWTPIERTETCRRHGIPLKRGVLAEGPFGTGKTLLAYVTAKKCQENSWTFIMMERVQYLQHALNFAAMYQPAVVFCEDIDRETGGERDADMDTILNTIDGLASKGKDIITILTSNEAGKINRAMLRPGRLDAVLRIDPPDAAAAERLMRIYGRGLIRDGSKLTRSAKELEGQIPAVIRECVERAKLYAISRIGDDEAFELIDADVLRAAQGMKHHLELLYGTGERPPTPDEQLGRALRTIVGSQTIESTHFKVEKIAEAMNAD